MHIHRLWAMVQRSDATGAVLSRSQVHLTHIINRLRNETLFFRILTRRQTRQQIDIS